VTRGRLWTGRGKKGYRAFPALYPWYQACLSPLSHTFFYFQKQNVWNENFFFDETNKKAEHE
jgi:hypothetical protein